VTRPDAIPVRPTASRAGLTPALVAALFGDRYALRGTERVDVVRLGRVLAQVPVRSASAPALALDAVDAAHVERADGLRLQGPAGSADAPAPTRVRSRLVLSGGLRRAWGVGERATLGLGPLALVVEVDAGAEAAARVERAAWLAAGRPETARWLPDVALAEPAASGSGVAEPAGPYRVPRRVVTETDVRQARLHRRTIRVGPDQVVTPAALSLGREWGVLDGLAARP
jgi:hypothetical protein